VILDLCAAVKELVENALDASAKTVDISIKEWGLESLVVADDGTGIHKQNFQSIGRCCGCCLFDSQRLFFRFFSKTSLYFEIELIR
jgi:DNA topoisomerase VI subunit B